MPEDPLDPVFRALAHPVRRRLLDMLKGGALSTGDLAAAFPEYSRFAIMQHLGVLEEARLVIPEKEGRLVLNHLNAAPLREAYERWVGEYEGHWAAALVGLKRTLEMPPNEKAARRANARRADSKNASSEPRARARDESRPMPNTHPAHRSPNPQNPHPGRPLPQAGEGLKSQETNARKIPRRKGSPRA